ncbi:unnamed protein product [Triticum turgidum subsp. durum]|uniref:Auxin-responsive protein n=2 Tax=Triticum TaxID=4564 RepID=A0A9R1QC06_TRITD|nr:unnamed protein product [Triticum aestivum]VAH73846.1 unnamed protein product [Triticum turgidum subsp. durum]
MSAETERSSTESSAASGLDFEDTALTLTLRLPGDPDRKRGASSSSSCSLADRSSLLAEAPPAPKAAAAPAKFVKVAVDGAPYLRKVNLRDYAGYDQLLRALQGKFCSHFTIRKFANDEMKLVDAVNGTEYVPTYEDKDGDWMLVGDVPWK